MKKSFVYMLRCADGTLYTGWTNDLCARVRAHNGVGGTGAKYTRSRRPVTLAYFEECEDPRAAMRREFALKRQGRAAKERLIACATAFVTVEGAEIPCCLLSTASPVPKEEKSEKEE